MNRIAKVLAPVALVFAAFGAQASEVAYGDIGAKAAQAGSAQGSRIAAQSGHGGEVAVGDIGTSRVVVGSTGADTPVMAGRVVSNFAVGA